MMKMTSRDLTDLAPRFAALSIAMFLAAALFAPTADAQGVCRCNNGCHASPGQCVQGGATGGCEAGYAPFCGNRAGTCPRTGWVSCSGDCTCARIPGYDAGTSDGSTPPLDASMSDAPATPADAPRLTDGAVAPMDAPRLADGALAPDGPAALTDGASVDGQPSMDSAPNPDAPPCACPGGVCVDGRCIRDRCSYQPELGFVCAIANTTCRLVEGEAWCVPACLGVTCGDGDFCDESSGGACAHDNCATIRCAGGLTCFHNQCGRVGDGGVFIASDGGASDDAGSRGATAVDEGGCGCRASGDSSGARSYLAIVACGVIAASVGRRSRRRRGPRRRARRATATSMTRRTRA